jgi:hypothetical protein
MRFWSYLLQRLGFVVPILLGVTVIVFVISHVIPGDPASVIAGMYASEEQVQRLRQEFGLDRPLWEQYWISIRKMVLEGDLGTSLYTKRPVLQDLITYLPATLELTTFAMVLPSGWACCSRSCWDTCGGCCPPAGGWIPSSRWIIPSTSSRACTCSIRRSRGTGRRCATWRRT